MSQGGREPATSHLVQPQPHHHQEQDLVSNQTLRLGFPSMNCRQSCPPRRVPGLPPPPPGAPWGDPMPVTALQSWGLSETVSHTHTHTPSSSVPCNFPSRHGCSLNPQKAQPRTGLMDIYPREPRTDLHTDTLHCVYSSLIHNLQKLAHKWRDTQTRVHPQMDATQGWKRDKLLTRTPAAPASVGEARQEGTM